MKHVVSAVSVVDSSVSVLSSLFVLTSQVIKGYNGTIIAYGQTNSGKTHTMFGMPENSPPIKGVIFDAITEIFDYIAANPKRMFHIRISSFEIYNEVVRDLLNSNMNHQNKTVNADPLQIRIAKDEESFEIVGLSSRTVMNVEDVMTAVLEGQERKKFGQSYLNVHSSRSHTIFRVQLHTGERLKDEPGVTKDPLLNPDSNLVDHTLFGHAAGITIADLTLVDLAGSEMLTEEFGKSQQKETKHINLSLTNLKSVITLLSEMKDHIPYRQSNLTKVLRSSLGGNAKTIIICACSLAAEYNRMTRHTLYFGKMAKNIQNRVKINLAEDVEHRDMLVNFYKQKVQALHLFVHFFLLLVAFACLLGLLVLIALFLFLLFACCFASGFRNGREDARDGRDGKGTATNATGVSYFGGRGAELARPGQK